MLPSSFEDRFPCLHRLDGLAKFGVPRSVLGWGFGIKTTFGSSVGNMHILWGPGEANRRASPSSICSSYTSGLEHFEVLLGLVRGSQINIHLGWHLY